MRRLRKDKGLTLDRLAELSNSSKSYIWELENRNPARPSADKLGKIAEQLGVTIEYLLDEKEEIQEEEAVDAEFYRQYRAMDSETKKKFREMVRLWGSSE